MCGSARIGTRLLMPCPVAACLQPVSRAQFQLWRPVFHAKEEATRQQEQPPAVPARQDLQLQTLARSMKLSAQVRGTPTCAAGVDLASSLLKSMPSKGITINERLQQQSTEPPLWATF